MEYILTTNNLCKKYKDTKVLTNLNIHLKKGAIYGLIGKNGAGKTTLIRIITGLQEPTTGTYTLYEAKNNTKDILISRKRIGAIIETPTLISDLTATENLILAFKDVGMPNLDDITDLLKLVKLDNTSSKKVANFSLGMKQRLAIALALANNPDLLILDEPINGLDPEGIIDIRELILKLNQERGLTILISSHYLDELSKIATDYGFLDHGTIIKEISSTELKQKMRHKIELKVSNLQEFVQYFETHHFNYEVINKNTLYLYDIPNLSLFLKELAQHNLFADGIKEQEETLENYYLNLIGGNTNA